MDNYTQPYEQDQTVEKSIFNTLEIDQTGKFNLAEAAKWAKFMGIIGMIMIVLMVLGGLAFITVGSLALDSVSEVSGMMPLGGAAFGLIYFVIAALYFYPTWTLLKFGTQTRLGIKNDNQEQFNSGLNNLKNCFKFVGILTVIIIGIYILGIIALFFGAGIGALG